MENLHRIPNPDVLGKNIHFVAFPFFPISRFLIRE
jgi:hypothetical protein